MENNSFIYIKTLAGDTHKLEISLRSLVDNLKEKIREELKYPPQVQRLIYGGKSLFDGYLLSDFNVKQGATIHLIVRNPSDVNK